MDYDETVNMPDYDYEKLSRQELIREITFTIFFIIGICADIVIIYTIFRFKRMRSIPNIFIANWAIADLFSLAVTPSSYGIISHIRHVTPSRNFYCVLEEAGSTLHITVFICVIVAGLDWFIGAYFGRASEKFRSNYKFIIGGVWIFAIVCITVYSTLRIAHNYGFLHQGIALLISYSATILLTIVMQTSRIIQKFRNVSFDYSTLTLNLITAYSACSFLSVICLLTGISHTHIALLIISICLLFSSSIVNLSILYFLDKDFHACLLQAFKRSGDRYVESISYFDNPIINTNHKDTVRVSFDNSEGLLTNVG